MQASGGKDVIVDYRVNDKTLGADKISLAGVTESGFSISGNDLIIGFGGESSGDSLKIVDGKLNNTIAFANGKTTENKIYDNAGTFDAKRTSVTLAPTSEFDASATTYSGLLTIDGSAAGAASIVGNAKANRIIAGGDSTSNKGSSLIGGQGNDTLVGSSLGADVFIYDSSVAGNDTIIDYGAGDAISILSSLTIEDASQKTVKNGAKNTGVDVTFKVGKGAIVVKDLANDVKKITLTSGGFADSVYDVASGTFMATSESGVSVTLPANYNTKTAYKLEKFDDKDVIGADANALKKAVHLVANDKSNTLIGGKGNDTLEGGKGNDYFNGGDGADVFIFGGGADSIAKYELKDKINMDATLKGEYKGYSIVKASETAKTGDVVLDYGKAGSISIAGAMDTAISFTYGTDRKAEVQTFNEKGVFDSRKTAFSLQAAGGSATLTHFSESSDDFAKLVTISGSTVKDMPVNIVGNSNKANKLVAGDSGSTLNGGGKANDTLVGGAGADVFVYGSNMGNDIIESLGSGDYISLGTGLEIDDITKKTVKSKTDVIFKIGKNSLTVKDVGDGDIVLTGGVYSTESITYDYKNDVLIGGASTAVSILPSFVGTGNKNDTFTLADPTVTVNASKRKKPVNLVTNIDGSKVLIGGDGNDTLNSSSGTNSLTGGNGNDLFIFSGGNDTITDYNPKGDKIAISVGSGYAEYSNIDNGNVILTYGAPDSERKLTIINGKNSLISFVESGNKTNTKIYSDYGVSDGKLTAISLNAATFEAKGNIYDKLITIVGANADDAAIITGNAKGNVIKAGNSGATMNGKAGNDTLYGGATTASSADIFVYEKESGNDFILNYGSEDQISLGSGAKITDVTIKKGVTNGKDAKTDDLIVKVGKGTITIKDGVKSSNGVTFVGENSGILKSNGSFITDDDKTILFPSFSGSIKAETTTVDATSVKAGIAITGGDYIIGGNGNDTLSGSGTLWGGKGNDLLSGANTYIYHAGEGTDTITDLSLAEAFGNTPRLMLYDKGTTSTTTVGITKGTFNKDGLSLYVSGGGNVILADHGINGPSEDPIEIKGTKWYVGQAKNGSLTFTTTPYKRPEE